MGSDQYGLSGGQHVAIDRPVRDIFLRLADDRVAQNFDVVNMHLTTIGVSDRYARAEFTRLRLWRPRRRSRYRIHRRQCINRAARTLCQDTKKPRRVAGLFVGFLAKPGGITSCRPCRPCRPCQASAQRACLPAVLRPSLRSSPSCRRSTQRAAEQRG